ncbi:hypothetical protein Goari_020094 [Gossypium aridum]|uniref:RNase H type-1 domain-containing protein n=1 Tax=Gossypium aridum TaxID=34290 RepID=A0A7J8WV30_GOSAI|nr:hypothetical protein [Gossypium aridum]
MHQKLLLNEERVRRNLTDDAGCVLCGVTQESILHVLRDCHGANVVESDRSRLSRPVRIKWCPSSSGWVDINTDGAFNRDGNRLAAVGVIRDSHGNWVVGFKRFSGCRNVVNLELWAILHRHEIARTINCTKVIMESDCLIAIELIKESNANLSSYTLIRKKNEVTRHIQMVKFQYIPREGNMMADWLAKSCTCEDVEHRIIDFPNFYVRGLILEDKISTFHVRDC